MTARLGREGDLSRASAMHDVEAVRDMEQQEVPTGVPRDRNVERVLRGADASRHDGGRRTCTPVSEAPAATVIDTGSVAVRPPTSTSAVTPIACPNTSVAVPGTSTRPVCAHAPSSGSCHVTATGTPAPHAVARHDGLGQHGTTPACVRAATVCPSSGARSRGSHDWFAPPFDP